MHLWTRKKKQALIAMLLTFCYLIPSSVSAVSANIVWFEFHPGFYRVIFQYTLPEIKELREAYADFRKKKDAEDFYWGLVRGADFNLGNPKNIRFINPKKTWEPW